MEMGSGLIYDIYIRESKLVLNTGGVLPLHVLCHQEIDYQKRPKYPFPTRRCCSRLCFFLVEVEK